MTSCSVYNVIKYLESIYLLCINPIRAGSSEAYKLMFNLYCTSGWTLFVSVKIKKR